MSFVETVHRAIEDVPVLARFAILMVLIVIIPQLSRRIRLPGAVGLLLMFFAGLEINLPLFRQKIFRSIVFGVITTSIPLLLGTLAAHWLGYGLLPAVVVTFGATMISDTLSLLVFAICVPLYVSGFSAAGLALQIIEILVFVPLVLFGLGRAGAYILRKVENDEETYFILMLGMIAVSALLAQYINLPGIVGTFLAGLAVNAAVKDKPAKNKLEFMGNTLFIPIFFIVTGFFIDPLALLRSLTQDSFLAGGVIAALVAGKWIAAQSRGRLSVTPWQHAERGGRSRCHRSRRRSRPPSSRAGPSMPPAGRCSTRPGADATLRNAHVGTGAGSPRFSHELQLTGVCNSCEGARPVEHLDALNLFGVPTADRTLNA